MRFLRLLSICASVLCIGIEADVEKVVAANGAAIMELGENVNEEEHEKIRNLGHEDDRRFQPPFPIFPPQLPIFPPPPPVFPGPRFPPRRPISIILEDVRDDFLPQPRFAPMISSSAFSSDATSDLESVLQLIRDSEREEFRAEEFRPEEGQFFGGPFGPSPYFGPSPFFDPSPFLQPRRGKKHDK